MLPNDPLLALHQAKATMAERQHQSGQERLAAAGRFAAGAGTANSRGDPTRTFLKLVERLRGALAGHQQPARTPAVDEPGTGVT
jgi:hypothetical protein